MPISRIGTDGIENGAVAPADLSTGGPSWDGSGNVGIGTSSPSTYGQLAVYRNTTDGTNANIAAVNAGTTASYAGFQAQAGTVNWQVFSDAAGNAIGTAGAMIRTISNHPLCFGTNSTERMRLTANGDLGVGTTSPACRVDVSGIVRAQGSTISASGEGLELLYTSSTPWFAGNQGVVQTYNRGTSAYTPIALSGSVLHLTTGGTERARITSTGACVFGGTTAVSDVPYNFYSSTQGQIITRNNLQAAGRFWRVGVESGNDVFIIYPDSSGGVYMTRGATSWTGNSDERLKTDLKPIENAAQKIAQLRTVTGRFKTDEENVSRAFLIAQDVQAVLPEAVDTKDDEDGTLGIRYTDTIPLLVAAIKELKAELDATKAEVAALKGAA